MSSELLTDKELCGICSDKCPVNNCTGKSVKCQFIALKFVAKAQLAKDEDWYKDELAMIGINHMKEIQAMTDSFPARIAEVEKHYDDLADQYEEVVLPKIVAEERAKLIKWLDEPCTEHGNSPRVVKLEGEYGYSQAIIDTKRKDCSQCWQSIKELGNAT